MLFLSKKVPHEREGLDGDLNLLYTEVHFKNVIISEQTGPIFKRTFVIQNITALSNKISNLGLGYNLYHTSHK